MFSSFGKMRTLQDISASLGPREPEAQAAQTLQRREEVQEAVGLQGIQCCKSPQEPRSV